MFIDEKKGESFFISDSKYVLDYVSRKGIDDVFYKNFIENYFGGFVTDNTITVSNEEYTIQCFLGKSENTAYDIVKCNEIRELDKTPLCAIAMLYGDDLICINANDGRVYFFDDNELILLSENFELFIKSINLM